LVSLTAVPRPKAAFSREDPATSSFAFGYAAFFEAIYAGSWRYFEDDSTKLDFRDDETEKRLSPLPIAIDPNYQPYTLIAKAA
jgi:hypothetical protein